MRLAAMRVPTIALLAVLLPLAACHKTPEPAPEPENNVVEEAPPPVAPPPPAPMIAKPPEVKAPAIKLPPPPPADQQVLDDADATGMTARVSRDGDGGNGQ